MREERIAKALPSIKLIPGRIYRKYLGIRIFCGEKGNWRNENREPGQLLRGVVSSTYLVYVPAAAAAAAAAVHVIAAAVVPLSLLLQVAKGPEKYKTHNFRKSLYFSGVFLRVGEPYGKFQSFFAN